MNRRPKPAQEAGRVSPTAPKSRSVSDAVWNYIDTIPGAVESIERGERQIAEGKVTPLRELRNRR